ncbi:PH domain-containing protein [Solirubrobacter sp. CPCC 204708]|uniref:PH domain-containing protein n=1 Tax=Solirubrobacter deserti TaxID=2282478 RepID=A0ABT4RSS6_9ACTN|nr:PH domain-containing protein [Solirubrobacter deserti]MBE2316293.1 PH domain-containing protein [Solirubrobacter deserti]MDA0141500.1 PH domain-containing protein [Solirubrobacter deserti]
MRSLSPIARRVWRLSALVFWLLVLIAGVIVALAVDGAGPWPWIGPLVLGAAWVIVVPELRWRRWRWDLTEEGIDIQHGALTVSRTLIPWVRVQHVETQRGLFEQAFDLATVNVFNAAGSHTIPLLAQADAEELRERIAARAETDDEDA